MESAEHLSRFGRSRSGWSFAFLLIVILAGAPCVHAQQAFQLNGARVAPLQQSLGKILVFVFVRTDCPISNRYAPLIQELSAKYAQTAVFTLVFPDKTESAEAIRTYLQEFGYKIEALRDVDLELAKKTGVKVTPEVAVFNAQRELVYHGRIDNLYPSLGKSRHAATTHELADAIDAAVRGVAPAKASAPAVGCFIADVQ